MGAESSWVLFGLNVTILFLLRPYILELPNVPVVEFHFDKSSATNFFLAARVSRRPHSALLHHEVPLLRRRPRVPQEVPG